MPSKKLTLPDQGIDNLIREIRGQKVILDSDLAALYGIPTFRFNEAIKRNRHRFPTDFMFQLTREEFDSLTSQIAMSEMEGTANSSQIAMSSRKHRGTVYRPWDRSYSDSCRSACTRNLVLDTASITFSGFVNCI